MEIQVENKYKDIPALIRYATIILTYRTNKDLSPYGEKIISISNRLKLNAFPLNLLNSSNNQTLYKALKPYFQEQNQEKNVISLNQADSHFIDSIGVADIDKNLDRIISSYTNLFNTGNFDKLNRACYRFLKRMKGVNEYDMNDAIIRYMVATISLRDFNQCYNIIESLSQEYVLFDFNIYLFFLYLCEGRYRDALQKLLLIKNNIYDEFYEYIKEEDLAFYFAFCLLYNFNIHDYKEVLSNNDIYVYKLYDKYRNFFDIVDSYYKCDYLKVNNDFNKKLKERINKDPFLCGKSGEIEKEFKEKILKEILSFSTEINFKTISDLLVVDKKTAVTMISDLIQNEKIDAIIDDIDEVVIMKESNPMNDLMEKSNKAMENNLNELIKFSYKNIKHKINVIEGKNLTRKNLVPGDYDMKFYMMMGETG
jgi:hypothetical protein